MKVTLKDSEINNYVLSVRIEVEGEEYIADLSYSTYDGYEVTFLNDNGQRVAWPKWAIDYDSNEPLGYGNDSLGYWLESQIGGFFKWEAQKVEDDSDVYTEEVK
jgi:hypothetical protein